MRFIKDQGDAFLVEVHKLLLFFAVRRSDLGLVNHIMADRKIPIDFYIGKQQNSLLIELAKSLYKGREKDSINSHPKKLAFVASNYSVEIVSIIKSLLGGVENQLLFVRYCNLYGKSALHYFSERDGHDAMIRFLLELRANPLLPSKSGMTPLANVLHYYSHYALQSATWALLQYGAGLARLEYRAGAENIILYKMFPAIFYFERIKFLENLKHFYNNWKWKPAFHPDDEKKFAYEYCHSKIVISVLEKQTKYGPRLIEKGEQDYCDDTLKFSLSDLSSVLLFHRSGAIFSKQAPHLSIPQINIIRQHVLETDDKVVDPVVKKLFAMEIKSCLCIGDFISKFLSSDCSDIVISYITSDISYKNCLAFTREKIKSLLDIKISAMSHKNICFQKLTHEQFIQGLCKAMIWETRTKYNMYSSFNRYEHTFKALLEEDDKLIAYQNMMQTLIDNGLVARAKLDPHYQNLLIQVILKGKYNYIQMLAKGGEAIDETAKDADSEDSAFTLLIKKLQEAQIKIQDLSISVDESGKPSPPLFIQFTEALLNAPRGIEASGQTVRNAAVPKSSKGFFRLS